MGHCEENAHQEACEECVCEPYGAPALVGMAALGAITSVGLYVLYHNLADDTRKAIREGLVTGLKSVLQPKS